MKVSPEKKKAFNVPRPNMSVEELIVSAALPTIDEIVSKLIIE